MNKLRVMMLMHSELVPPEDLIDKNDSRMEKFRTEYDVKNALLSLGHEVKIVPVTDEVLPIRNAVEQWKPHIAFNLLEAFADNGAWDYYVVSYLQMLKVPCTGCNPRGMLLSRDKALSKKILHFHRIKVPEFRVFYIGKQIKPKKVKNLPYPMIVKSLTEQGSIAIAQASFVNNEKELRERVAQVHEMTGEHAIAEQYIDGRELYVTVVGNTRLQVLPIRELVFDKVDENQPRIATYQVKWNEQYRKRWGIEYQFARNLPNGTAEHIERLAKRIYRSLDLSSYARIDLRLANDGKIYVLEANPNAGIARDEDVIFSAKKAGMSYEKFIQKILTLGLNAN
jgi:D-alanine-D-alanine ligase